MGERQTEDLKVPGSIPGLGISRRSTAARREIAAKEHRSACNSAARAQMLPFGIWLSLLTDDGSAWLTLRSSRNDLSICMC